MEDVQHRRRAMKGKAFCRWVNAHLKPEEHVNDIGQLYDGVALGRLTNFMLGQFIHEICYDPVGHEDHLQNLEILFEIWDDLKVNLRNKTVELIVDGDTETTESLLWSLIEWYEFKQQVIPSWPTYPSIRAPRICIPAVSCLADVGSTRAASLGEL